MVIDFRPAAPVPAAVLAERQRYARHTAGIRFGTWRQFESARGWRTLTGLPREERRALWESIQQERPALAGLLLSEPFQAIARTFDAKVMIPR